jgi:hypothetical protein
VTYSGEIKGLNMSQYRKVMDNEYSKLGSWDGRTIRQSRPPPVSATTSMTIASVNNLINRASHLPLGASHFLPCCAFVATWCGISRLGYLACSLRRSFGFVDHELPPVLVDGHYPPSANLPTCLFCSTVMLHASFMSN